MTAPETRARWWTKITRDVVLFTAGLVLTVNEGLFQKGQERPSLLLLYAGMMGLPAVFRYDERRRKDQK